MIEPNVYITIALASLAGLGMVVAGGLAGWRGWLSLRRMELDQAHDTGMPMTNTAGARIEIADLKERIKKLEAIAAGGGSLTRRHPGLDPGPRATNAIA